MMQIQGVPTAVAMVSGGEGNRYIRGTVRFFQRRGGVLVEADISGLPISGFFGFHIHEGGSCSGPLFSDTKGHYDPTNMAHPMHSGDLPPLLSAGGRAYMAVLTERFSIGEIVGKTIVVHGRPDDFQSQPAGNAGEKIACGVIQPVLRSRMRL